MKRAGMISGIILVLITNGLALLQTARDRSGGAIRSITLSDRELPREWMVVDDSGVTFRLAWKYRAVVNALPPEYKRNRLDQNALEQIGFRLPPLGSWSTIPRPISELRYAAFELGADPLPPESEPEVGPNQTSLNEWQRRSAVSLRSRLVFLEASADLQSLLDKYPDQQRVLIARAVITRLPVAPGSENGAGSGTLEWRGRVSLVLPEFISMPLPYSREFSRRISSAGSAARYQVTLSAGRAMEPWVSGLSLPAQ
jgi:hypothetical protein